MLKAVAIFETGSGGSGTVTEIDTGTGLTGGPIAITGTISIANSTANSLGGYSNSGVFSTVSVGSGLSLASGTISATFIVPDASNIVVGSTTGTKIATATDQKLSFWNATPVVQQVLATGAGHSADDIISFLQTLGLCKQS